MLLTAPSDYEALSKTIQSERVKGEFSFIV